MNPAEAIAANLARLSYNASLRARAALRRAAARLSVGQVIESYKPVFLNLFWFAARFLSFKQFDSTPNCILPVINSQIQKLVAPLELSAALKGSAAPRLPVAYHWYKRSRLEPQASQPNSSHFSVTSTSEKDFYYVHNWNISQI